MLIFISYANEDKDKVQDVCLYLKRLNIDYWIDKDKLRPGHDWRANVLNILPHVDVVLFFMSEKSQTSESARWEIEQAQKLHRKIVNVKLTDCEIILPGQEDIIYIDLSNPDSLFENLNHLANELLGSTPISRIFINYRQGADPKDHELAKYLTNELTNHGADVWSDINEIDPSESWGESIKRGIDTSEWMLLIVSPTSMQSRRVDAIWREFINQGKESKLILVMSTMTSVNYKLHGCRYADFTKSQNEGWQQLIAILQGSGARGISPVESTDHTTTEPNKPLEWHKDQGTLYLISPQAVQPRHRFSKPEAMIQKAQHEIWISAVSMTKVAQADLTRFLTSPNDNNDSRMMRFLVIDPVEDRCLEDASGYLGVQKEKLRRQIEFSLSFLSDLKSQFNDSDQIQIRVMKHRPSSGYFIIDPQKIETGAMTISPYFYDIDNIAIYKASGKSRNDLEPPFIYLTRLAERQSFDVFREDFLRSWEKARVWPDGPYNSLLPP